MDGKAGNDFGSITNIFVKLFFTNKTLVLITTNSSSHATTDSFTSTSSVFSISCRWYSETHIYTVKAHCVNTTGIAVVCHTAVGVFSSLTVAGITAEDNTVKYSRVKPLASGAEQSRAEQIVVEHHPV